MSTPSIANLRRRATKLGWSFYRSTWHRDTCDNRGGYMLVAGSRMAGTVLDGDKYDASLEGIAHRIEQEERRLA